jgi:hypothetical protein
VPAATFVPRPRQSGGNETGLGLPHKTPASPFPATPLVTYARRLVFTPGRLTLPPPSPIRPATLVWRSWERARSTCTTDTPWGRCDTCPPIRQSADRAPKEDGCIGFPNQRASGSHSNKTPQAPSSDTRRAAPPAAFPCRAAASHVLQRRQ